MAGAAVGGPTTLASPVGDLESGAFRAPPGSWTCLRKPRMPPSEKAVSRKPQGAASARL